MKKILIIIAALLIAALIAVFISTKEPMGTQVLPTPVPLPSDYDKNYSNMNYLKPGKSTIGETIKINGRPKTKSSFGSKVTLAYATPNSSHLNTVVFKNNILQHAIEYVYSSYRGHLSDYIKTYGTPGRLFSNEEDGLDWHLFFENGIGIESSNNDITRVLYFIPQDKKSFLETVGKELEITEAPPMPVEEVLVP